MHDLEPFYYWRDEYDSAFDKYSPFYGRQYDEFFFTHTIYNFYIHPQWDYFGSPTLYMKILYADYERGFAIFEMLGEWNDCITNDIMYLKRDVADVLMEHGINKFIIICENVLNFHSSDDCYYEEWFDDLRQRRMDLPAQHPRPRGNRNARCPPGQLLALRQSIQRFQLEGLHAQTPFPAPR